MVGKLIPAGTGLLEDEEEIDELDLLDEEEEVVPAPVVEQQEETEQQVFDFNLF